MGVKGPEDPLPVLSLAIGCTSLKHISPSHICS